MKKLVILLTFLLGLQIGFSQATKIYVSKHDGGKRFLNFGKLGYNDYHFSGGNPNCDTLLCKGKGYEACKIDKDIIAISKANNINYQLFNKAISATSSHIVKTKTKEGKLDLTIDNRKVSVSYINASGNGESDMIIELL